MQLAHTLQNGKILNVLCLDFIGQRVVVDTPVTKRKTRKK